MQKGTRLVNMKMYTTVKTNKMPRYRREDRAMPL